MENFSQTRSYAALRAADLDWIVGPGYSLGRVHSGEKPWKTNLEPWKTMETNQKPGRNKQKRDQGGVTTDLGGGQGRNKQKRDWRGVTTDLLDV